VSYSWCSPWVGGRPPDALPPTLLSLMPQVRGAKTTLEVVLGLLSRDRLSSDHGGVTTAEAVQRRRGGPVGATAYALATVVLFVPAITLFCLTTTAIPLVILTVGLLILYVSVPCTEWVASLHRMMAARILDRPVPPTYAPTRGLGFFPRLRV